jgi:hypothetical protein
MRSAGRGRGRDGGGDNGPGAPGRDRARDKTQVRARQFHAPSSCECCATSSASQLCKACVSVTAKTGAPADFSAQMYQQRKGEGGRERGRESDSEQAREREAEGEREREGGRERAAPER